MSSHRVKPGDVLDGKYRVERELGAGGMGIVVAARHIDLGQIVALKFMLAEAMSDPAHAERFLREAKAAVQLKSTHTARVLDVGRLRGEEPYMVMEYLEGRDLDAELRARGRLPPHVAVDYVLQASEALAEAHGLGMIHRDIKLKNLFLTQTVDGRPLVKVLDFGLAKTLNSDVSLTATNSVFGSPQYMSPEQMRSARDVDIRSDIWSMGVCLFEMVTGRVPFDAGGVAEICAMVLKDPVPAPSEFARGVPADLEAVILKCLEKDASKRYQTFAELAFALQDYAPDEGSARRVLHAMHSSSKSDVATISSGQLSAVDAGAKTVDAWDSAVPTGRTLRLSRAQWVAGASLFGTLALVGVISIAIVLLKAPSREARSTSGAVSVAPPAAFVPPASGESTAAGGATAAGAMPAQPLPVGTLLGASPTDDEGVAPPSPATDSAPAAPPSRNATRASRSSPTAHTSPQSPAAHAPAPASPTTKAAAGPAAPASGSRPATKPKGLGSGADYM